MTRTLFAPLDIAGLNLHAVFEPASLPEALRARLSTTQGRQLILIGNVGPAFWRALNRSRPSGANPIDDFSTRTVHDWLQPLMRAPMIDWIYPGEMPINLQALGELAGWHHPSLLKLGIHPDWGSWFAYRALVLAETDLPLTPIAAPAPSPCARCADTPCVSACPARAIAPDGLTMEACLSYRLSESSACVDTCLARLACPLGSDARYPVEQIRHMYRHSLAMIRAHRAAESTLMHVEAMAPAHATMTKNP